jgi:hypothetical protein
MPTNDSLQAAAQAFENMSDEEARNWFAAGDYTAVAGIPLPAEASRRIAELADEQDVQGFGMDLNPLGSVQTPISGVSSGEKGAQGQSLFKNCCTGSHFKKVILEMR